MKIYRRGTTDAYEAPIELRSEDILTSPLFPGLTIPLAPLFR
jgi:hypothetical protein